MSVLLGDAAEGDKEASVVVEGLASLDSREKPADSGDGNFHLVCWNVHKADDSRFADELGSLLAEIPDLDEVVLCLQEARSTTYGLIKDLGGVSKVKGHYAASWRYPLAKESTGVMTLSDQGLAPESAEGLHSRSRELFVTSPKVCLRSDLALADGRRLVVVNCHGLNFVTLRRFEEQLKQVFDSIGPEEADGNADSDPVILCGDFNVWSGRRLQLLEEMALDAGLAEAGADQHSGPDTPALLRLLTPIFGYDPSIPLDRIYSRGIEIFGCRSLQNVESSDHSPLVLDFSISG